MLNIFWYKMAVLVGVKENSSKSSFCPSVTSKIQGAARKPYICIRAMNYGMHGIFVLQVQL